MEPLTLGTVPREVFLMIVESLARPQDLNSLCQVSRGLYAETVPYLYRSISLYTPDEDIEAKLTSPFRAAGERGLLRHTEHIKLWSIFYDSISSQCLHRNSHKCHRRDSDAFEVETEDLVAQLQVVLGNCEPGAIKSLCWELGACIPLSLLGPDGYFAREQQGLESIRLVTDGSCAYRAPYKRHLALGSFPRLRRFSWTGATSQAELDIVSQVLSRRSAQLEAIEIDLSQRRDLIQTDDSLPDSELQADFALRVLKLPGRGGVRFPVLRELTLAAVSLKSKDVEAASQTFVQYIHDAIDFGALRSLTLRDCHGWEELTKQLVQRAERIRLKSLEIQWSRNSDTLEPYEALLPFLQAFQGLEELFVHATIYTDSRPLWAAVLNHCATLRRFAHHQRLQDQSDPTGDFEEACDTWDQSFSVPAGVEDDSLGRLDLTCLGLSCNPRQIRTFVSGLAAKTTLRMLHVRQSGPDLGHYPSWAESADDDDPAFDIAAADFAGADFPALGTSFVEFAQWAFGPDGIRSLRLLAYGDFSYEGRFAEASLLFCRQEEAVGAGNGGKLGAGPFLRFREVREGQDWELWDLFESENRFLRACPCDTLFHTT